ncbi:uncharacterized protein BKA55DRAFT_600412 [Fusarium redolens]|uniref:Integral membrane protein n=1 Tax=Fusarium redolens TaxID=48865 RepID=A0A9P9FUJ3_FUSRE|nr:uncharacterized protein BKA55DRAFT_600412 [Fusarium redolens]KAH7204883.1 hypothetical protein BKA55DRAFT_600412 [Fusarium redolens]
MDQDAHLPHDSLGPRALAIVTPFLIIAIIVFSVQIYTRVTPVYKLDASDYTISVAILIEVIVYSLFIASVTSGLGRHSYDISPEQGVKTLRYVYVVILLSTLVPALARISHVIIWLIIGIQAACIIGTKTFQLIHIQQIWIYGYAAIDIYIELYFSRKVLDSNTNILLALNRRGYSNNSFFRADTQVPS